MTILALDTAGPVCSVALLTGQTLRYEARALNRLTHSTSLMPMVDEALRRADCRKADLSHIAAVVGPGSFTGVRIGVAAAQGLARALGLPCLAVNALEAMAHWVAQPGLTVCPIRDARSGQVYGAAFRDGQRLLDDSAMKLQDYLRLVDGLADRLYFLGDGAVVQGEAIRQALGARALIAPAHLLQPGAAAAAVLAANRPQQAVDPGQLMPLYLRAPQAVRQLAKRDG